MPILRGDYNNLDVPEDILNKVVLDDLLFVDVLNAGPRTGTGLDETSTTQRGEVKNHWRWRALIPGNGGEDGQIVFGFNLKQAPSVASDAAQYAGRSSIGAGSNLGSDHTHSQSDSEEAAFSDVSSLGKPPVVESDNRSRFESQGSTEGQGNVEGGRTSFNDDEARNIAPSIRSSDGNEIAQPVKEGAPVPGCLEIQVRTHTARSVKAIFSCSFRLKAKTTFRELFDAVVSRGMLPFHFRKLDAAYFGCRDGMCVVYYVFVLFLADLRTFRHLTVLRPRLPGSKMG